MHEVKQTLQARTSHDVWDGKREKTLDSFSFMQVETDEGHFPSVFAFVCFASDAETGLWFPPSAFCAFLDAVGLFNGIKVSLEADARLWLSDATALGSLLQL